MPFGIKNYFTIWPFCPLSKLLFLFRGLKTSTSWSKNTRFVVSGIIFTCLGFWGLETFFISLVFTSTLLDVGMYALYESAHAQAVGTKVSSASPLIRKREAWSVNIVQRSNRHSNSLHTLYVSSSSSCFFETTPHIDFASIHPNLPPCHLG